MVAQLRSWLPDPIGGVYWVFLDNPYVSPYIPIYAGVHEIAEPYKIYNPDKFDPKSARWEVDFVDNLMYLRWQEANQDLKFVQGALEKNLFENQKDIEKRALQIYETDPQAANKFLTEYTAQNMEEMLKQYTELRYKLIEKYSNNVLEY